MRSTIKFKKRHHVARNPGGSSTGNKCNSIFQRRYRLAVRRQLLHTIVLGNDAATVETGTEQPVTISDQELMVQLEAALREPEPRPHTPIAKILLRYCFHVADYFPSDRIAPIQTSLLERVSRIKTEACLHIWEGLEVEIRKGYQRYSKAAALDFILSDGSASWSRENALQKAAKSSGKPPSTTSSNWRKLGPPARIVSASKRVKIAAVDSGQLQQQQQKPLPVIRRSLGRKLCIHHFYGRKFLALWHKFIRPIDWCNVLRREHWELGDLKNSWAEELKKAEQNLIDGWQTIIKHVVKYALRKKVTPPSEGNVTLICRTLDTLVGLLLQQWRQDSMVNFTKWLTSHGQSQMVFVIHVTLGEATFKFDPPVEEIRAEWSQFCALLSVAAYRSLQSSVMVFDLIRQHYQQQQQQPAAVPGHSILSQAWKAASNSITAGLLRSENQSEVDQQPVQQPIKVKTPPEFLDHIREVIDESFREDEATLASALEPFLLFSSLLKDSVEASDSKDTSSSSSSTGLLFDQLQERVIHYRSVLKRIEADLPGSLSIGRRYYVQMGGMKVVLKTKIASLIDLLLIQFSKNFTIAATAICQDYAKYADTALTVPQSTAQWIQQRDQVDLLVTTTLPEADEQIRKMLRCFLFMCDQMLVVGESHSALAREVIMWKRRMSASQVEHGRLLRRKRTELEEALKKKRGKVVENVNIYSSMIDNFQRMGDIDLLSQYVEQARSLLYRLDEAVANVRCINEEEAYFSWEKTEYPLLGKVREQLIPFLNFFDMSSSFLNQQQQWLDSRLGSFDPDTIVRETENFAGSLANIEEQLPDISDIRHLLSQVEIKLRDFNKVLPLIRTLGNPALRERHWEQIWETVGVRLSSEAATSLQQLLALQLNEHLKKIEVISHSATQEMALENALLRMKNQWTSVALPIESYRVGEGKVLGKVDSIQLLVEDHMMETQIMRRSPFVKPFEKDAREWEQQLNNLQVLLEHCVFIQERWCSLEPLLTSPDVLSIAPDEARKFSAIDKNWRDVLVLIGQCKQIFSLLYAERMNERLNICIQQIQQLEKNLHNLMENKRLQYPRFFLLAEDELKHLLSLSRDPHKFATCLWRLYEGVHDLEFTPENDVTHVVSATGERLLLKEPVSYAKCKGQLDKFLNQLEAVLKQTLNQVICETVKDFDGKQLKQLLSSPSQIIILTVQIYCTNLIDEALYEADKPEIGDVSTKLDEFFQRLQTQLKSSTDRVHKLTAESLALVTLYYRELLTELSSNDQPALLWESTLKFRWNPSQQKVQIQLMEMSLDYGMEYIGQPSRMMAYADAKRTGLTVTNALSQHLAGVLVGVPRTELLESLSHCLGQRMIRFDCSEMVGAQDILRQIRGATTCGIWLCYNRIQALNRSTTSFMASLLVQLQNIASTTPPWLELTDTNLPQYGVFCLTEQDGQQRRSLFDSTLERTTSLGLQDLESLAQVLFPSQWKVVLNYLSDDSVQESGLHQQSHSIIETLKQIYSVARKMGSLGSALLTWQSARIPIDRVPDTVAKLSQFLPSDTNITAQKTNPLVAHCPAACQKLKLHFSERVAWKLSNLHDAFCHPRLPVLIYGPRLSGKTSLLHILIESLRLLNPQRTYAIEKICIGAYTEEALISNASHSIIPQLIRHCTSGGVEKETLVVLYGPYMEGVHDILLQALCGEGVLCLRSTEQIVLPENVHWCFEMSSIERVSPAHAAQCRLIPLDGQRHLTYQCLVSSWLATLSPTLLFIEPLLSLILPAVLDYTRSIEERARLASGYHPVKAVKHLLSLIRSMTDGVVAEATGGKTSTKQIVLDTDVRTWIQASILFSVQWTLAVPGYIEDKEAFSDFFHDLMDRAVQNGHLFSPARPPRSTGDGPHLVFDYRLMPAQMEAGKEKVIWQLWSEELKTLPSLSRDIAVNELFIPTTESVRCQHLISLFIQCGVPCVLVGPHSAGKTATARHYLRTRLNKTTHQVIIVNSSTCLDARIAQRILMGQMERRRKSVYGPTLGKKAVIFFDDIQTEKDNTKIANRVDMLLRQCIQNGQVFDGQEGGASTLIDIDFLATTRGGGMSGYKARSQDDSEEGERPDEILQTFAPIVVDPPNLDTASVILNRMLLWHLDARGFAKEFDAVIDQMIYASLGIYQKLRECQVLASFPGQDCRWDLRDLMRCIHGLLLSVPETIEDVGAIKRLWIHEAIRVFSDRLPLLEPTALVAQYVEKCCEIHFQITLADLFAQMDMVELADISEMNVHSIFFCDFSDPKSESRSYVEVLDMEHLTQVVNGYVTEYNNMNKKPMHYMTVFRHFMRTMSKASRVIKQPSGHLVLVGPKGVGRHSLARITGHAADCHVHQYETTGGGPDSGWNLSDWTDAFKAALVSAADDEKRSVFICSDAEFERPECRALVNHVIANGDVMYLFDAKERNELVEQMRAIDLQKEKTLQTDGSAAALKTMFETRMWEQIRIIIVLSCNQYNMEMMRECPQVLSACQTVWIHPWPLDAIEDITSHFFKDVELDADQKSKLLSVVKLIHSSTAENHYYQRKGEEQQKLEFQQYGLLMDFLQVALNLTKTFRQEFKYRQELCSQAGDKLELAAKKVVEMEIVAEKWKESLSQHQQIGGEAAVRTERDVELITCQIDRAKDLLTSLHPYQERWKEAVISLETRIHCCQADSALTAASIVFGGQMKESDRKKSFNKWTEQCLGLIKGGSGIVITPGVNDYTSLVEAEVREIEAAWIMANLPRDSHCIRSAVALRHVQRVPLLIDPHNIAEKWIDALNATKENKPTYVHMAAPDYLEQVSGALQLGTVVVIDITQTAVDPAILPVVLKQIFGQGSSNYVKLGAEVVEYASEFQLYLRSQIPVRFVDLQLQLCVTSIDLTLEQPGIYDTLVSALVNSERPDTEEKIQLCKQMNEIRCQLDETEQSLLNILSQSDSDWIENDAVITSLLPAITQSKILKEKLDVLLQTRERMEIQRQSFAPTALLAGQILSSLWCMESLFRRLHFPLTSFAESVVACLEDGDGDTEDFDSNATPARKLAARLFNRKLKSGFNRVQRLLAALLLNHAVANSENLCGNDFIQDLATGKLQRDKDGTRHLLSKEQSSLEGDPPSPEWMHFVKQVKLPENRSRLAYEVETLSQNLLKFSTLQMELSDYTGSVADVNSQTPLLLFVEPGVDMLTILSRMCREFDFPEDRVRFSSVAGLDSLNWPEVEDCVRRGNWLVLQGFAHLRCLINNIRTLLEHLVVDNISAEFKLFIIWDALDAKDDDMEALLPRLLLENCRTLHFEHVHTPEDCFHELIRSFEFDRLMNDPQRTGESYPIKLQTVAILLILRVILYDRWNCLIPLSEVWQTVKQMNYLTERHHPWAPSMRRVIRDNFTSHIESNKRNEFDRFIEDLLTDSNPDWLKAKAFLTDAWGQTLSSPIVDFSSVSDWLVDQKNEDRRQEELSEELWLHLKRGFAHFNPSDSIDMVDEKT